MTKLQTINRVIVLATFFILLSVMLLTPSASKAQEMIIQDPLQGPNPPEDPADGPGVDQLIQGPYTIISSSATYDAHSGLMLGVSKTSEDFITALYYLAQTGATFKDTTSGIIFKDQIATSDPFINVGVAEVDGFAQITDGHQYHMAANHYVYPPLYFWPGFGLGQNDIYGYRFVSGTRDYAQSQTIFPAGPFPGFWLGSVPIGVTHDDFTVPTLTVSSANLTRGDVATFTVNNSVGDTATEWTFTPSTPPNSHPGIVVRDPAIQALSWAGAIVTSGKVTVTVDNHHGMVFHLNATVTVNNRDWHLSPVDPGFLTNGSVFEGVTFQVLNPPVAGSPAGKSNVSQPFHCQPIEINTDSPNKNYKVCTDQQNFIPGSTTWFKWTIPQDIKNTASDFALHQYGNYTSYNCMYPLQIPGQPPTGMVCDHAGFIGAQQLLHNAESHEAGLVDSHYIHYVFAQNLSFQNLGDVSEKFIDGPDVTGAIYVQNLSNLITQMQTAIRAQTAIEPCALKGGFVEYDSSNQCVYGGPINSGPNYAPNVPVGLLP